MARVERSAASQQIGLPGTVICDDVSVEASATVRMLWERVAQLRRTDQFDVWIPAMDLGFQLWVHSKGGLLKPILA